MWNRGVDPLDTLWRTFHDQKNSLDVLAREGDELGVTHPCAEEGYFTYFAGGKAMDGEGPEGYESWELCPGNISSVRSRLRTFEALVMDTLYKSTAVYLRHVASAAPAADGTILRRTL